MGKTFFYIVLFRVFYNSSLLTAVDIVFVYLSKILVKTFFNICLDILTIRDIVPPQSGIQPRKIVQKPHLIYHDSIRFALIPFFYVYPQCQSMTQPVSTFQIQKHNCLINRPQAIHNVQKIFSYMICCHQCIDWIFLVYIDHIIGYIVFQIAECLCKNLWPAPDFRRTCINAFYPLRLCTVFISQFRNRYRLRFYFVAELKMSVF